MLICLEIEKSLIGSKKPDPLSSVLPITPYYSKTTRRHVSLDFQPLFLHSLALGLKLHPIRQIKIGITADVGM